MTLEITVDLGVEIPPDISYLDLRARARAACEAIAVLQEHGMKVRETNEDKEVAASLLSSYVADPETTSATANTVRAAELTPASLRNLRVYLDEYGQKVVDHAVELRYVVTNRLLEESQNPDPRIRIRALELLGKISDVGLFTERSEVLVTHQSTDELRTKLRQKLQKLLKPVQIGGETIDVDAELGLTPPKTDELRTIYVAEDEDEGA
jgi:hypothetical protein